MIRHPILPILILFFCACELAVGEIRASFLNTPAALQDTIDVLRQSGCPEADLLCFRRAVTTYYNAPFTVNISAFPPAKDGYYNFPSTSAFVAALNGKLFETNHSSQITCFDTAILLAGAHMNSRQEILPQTGPFLVAVAGVHGLRCTPVASLADAYELAYPDGYRESLKNTAGWSVTAKRKVINVSLCSFHIMPFAVYSDNLHFELLKILRADWARTGLVFPKNVSVVLLHEVAIENHAAVTDHAGILVPYQNKYMYIEKSGGQGPFLRLDVESVSDLVTYYESLIDPKTSQHFMTVNDQEIRELKMSR